MISDHGPHPPEHVGEAPLRDEAMGALLKTAATGGFARLSWNEIAEEARRRRRRRSTWRLAAAALVLLVAAGAGIELYQALLPTPTLVITDESLPGDAQTPPAGVVGLDIRLVEGGELPQGIERAVGTDGDHLWAVTKGRTYENYGPSKRGWGTAYQAEAGSDARVVAYGPSNPQAGGAVVVWTGLDAMPGTEREFEPPGDLVLTGFSLSPSGRTLILMGAPPPENPGVEIMTRQLLLVDTASGDRRELPWVLEGSYQLVSMVWATDEQSIYLTAAHTGGADPDRVYRLELTTGKGERLPDLAQVLAVGPDGMTAGLARADVELYAGMPEFYGYFNGTPGLWSVIDSQGNREPLLRVGESSVDPGLPDRAIPVQALFSADASMLAAVYLRQDLGLTFVNHVRTGSGWVPVSYYVGAGHDEWGIGGRLLGWDRAGSASLFDYEVPEGAGTDTQPPGHYLIRLPAQSDIQGTASPADGWMRSFLQEPPLPGPVLAVAVAGSPSAIAPSSGTSPSTSEAGPPPGTAAQIDTLLGFIRPGRTSGDIFLPVPHLSPHEQPGFANGSQGARAGYRINYEVDVGTDRWVTVGVEFKELTDAYLGLKAENRLTPTGISFDGNEWQQGTNSDGDVILGVEIPATDSADPYVLTIRVKTIDTALGIEVAGSMKRFANP